MFNNGKNRDWEHSTTGHHGHHVDYGHHQQQAQQLQYCQRSADASAQMVYEVYGNCIAILKEYEQREQKTSRLTRSNIEMVDQSHKDENDVKRIVEAQLLMLETQIKSCRDDVRDNVTQQLKDSTMEWCAERHDKQLSTDSYTDKFAGQIYEILSRGRTTHPEDFYQKPGEVADVSIEEMQLVLSAQHKIKENDRKFEGNPTRKAKTPSVRSGDKRIGAERLRTVRRDLQQDIPPEYLDQSMR
ncbi:uncharacterized protein LOC127723458 [Mytilus californianus]|uniref:uncharacterized protein LOC127723458 n=1 Tax=Mytilus californianus TaxID=6549 RepID=UPI002246B694|nr:uncharacterized protein LOC127723458 [Mytilus californianus]